MAAVWVVAATACASAPADDGGGDAGGAGGAGGGSTEPLTTEQVCAGLVDVVCEALFACGCDPDLRAYADVADCRAKRQTVCVEGLDEGARYRIEEGSAIWLPAAVTACYEQLSRHAAACHLEEPAACRTLLADPAPLEVACAEFNQGAPCAGGAGRCESDLRCAALPTAGAACPSGICAAEALCVQGSCVARPAGGDACEPGLPCADGLVCVAGVCGPRVAEGGVCSGGDECEVGLTCEPASLRCVAATALAAPCSSELECGARRACVRAVGARSCEPGGDVGASCNYAIPCRPDLRCSLDVCVELPAIGASCANLYECEAGATCLNETCVAVPGLGEPCLLDAAPPFCAPGLGCDREAGVCASGGAEGEPCHFTGGIELCQPGLACQFEGVNNVCRPKSARGGVCSTDENCAPEDFCNFANLQCAERYPADAPCRDGNECAAGLLCQPGPSGVRCLPIPAPGEDCVFACAGDTVCSGIGGICAAQVCAVP